MCVQHDVFMLFLSFIICPVCVHQEQFSLHTMMDIQADGIVYTADTGVLHGTVRTMALAACAKLGIPVVLQPPPKPSDTSPWQGAFLTSTSRLVLPIDALINGGGRCLAQFSYPAGCIVEKVAASVAADALTCSEPVF